MALATLLKDLAVWVGGYDFSGYMKSIRMGASKAELASGVFSDGVVCYKPGIVTVDAGGAGFWNAESALAPDPVEFARVKADATPADWPFVVIPPNSDGNAANTVANEGYATVGNAYEYNIGAAHGALLPFTLKKQPSTAYSFYRVSLELAKASRTATTTSTGQQLGALSATQQLIVILQVFSITGTGEWTLTVESDDNSDFSSATVRATFSTVDQDEDPAFEVVKIAGAITDNWWRVVLTETSGTSTVSAAVVFGIANLT